MRRQPTVPSFRQLEEYGRFGDLRSAGPPRDDQRRLGRAMHEDQRLSPNRGAAGDDPGARFCGLHALARGAELARPDDRFAGAPCVCRQHRQGRLQSLLRADLGQDQQVLAPDARPARRAIPSLAMSGATTSATSVRAEHVPAVAAGGSLLSGSVPRPRRFSSLRPLVRAQESQVLRLSTGTVGTLPRQALERPDERQHSRRAATACEDE